MGKTENTGIAIAAGVLAKAMRHAASIVQKSQTIPILANAKLFADGDRLEITTSDLDTEIRQSVELARPGQLEITVDAARLSSLAGALDAGVEMVLVMENDRLAVRGGRSRWLLPTLPAQDFPVMPFDEARGLSMPGKELSAAISRVAPMASTEETRWYLCGLFLDEEAGKFRFAATDGSAVMILTTDHDFPPEAPKVIMPSKYARTLERLTSDYAEAIDFSWDERKMRARIGEITVTGKVIDGTYPEYRRVLPPEAEQPILVDPSGLRSAIRRVQLVGTEKTKGVKISASADALTVAMADSQGGQASEDVPASCAGGHETGFNSSLLSQMLEAIGGETVEIHHENAGAPALFRRAVPDGAMGVVSPWRI